MSSAAERQRRYRERKAAGLRAYRVYLDDDQVDMILQAGLVDESALDDPDVFADQFGMGLELMLANVTRNESRFSAGKLESWLHSTSNRGSGTNEN